MGQLVLSRKVGEQIVINNDITVTVIQLRGDKVRLGITAPQGVPVHRLEVQQQIEASAEARRGKSVVLGEPS